MTEEELIYSAPKDWGTFTGNYIVPDGEEIIIAHHAADEDEDEWTMVRKDGILQDVD